MSITLVVASQLTPVYRSIPHLDSIPALDVHIFDVWQNSMEQVLKFTSEERWKGL